MHTDDLFPIPLSSLLRRLVRELDADALYGLPRRSWWLPDPHYDLSLTHLGRRIANPCGPASGPHTQLAQNLVLAWLAGGRFLELKTVQVLDELEIARPCIHAPHVGYNIEWSQELRVPQSAAEYAKAWFLIHALCSEHGPGLWPAPDCSFDVSVGYDLAGLRSDKVRAYLDTMRDASGLLSQLRESLPDDLSAWRDIPCPSQISDSVTLSTFHGCPADEIEAIARQTLDWGWHTVVKLNPTLLGYDAVRSTLDALGYQHITLHRQAFDKDLSWAQMSDFIPRLQAQAQAAGLGFGVKFTNTLVCSSDEPPFSQDEMYLSGPPLHVLAVEIAARFRAQFPSLPITFSAGIDKQNFGDVIAAGVGPATSCTDLLKARGYARTKGYLDGLVKRMKAHQVHDLSALRAAAGPSALRALADAARLDPRYARAKNQTPPRKVGSALELLDCLSCDKCIPVCPNGANFHVTLPTGEHSPGHVRWAEGSWTLSQGDTLRVAKKHQIGNTADACNLCGHCDTWCPEDGGPYIVKPTLFLSHTSFDALPERDGFVLSADHRQISWRREGGVIHYIEGDDSARLELNTGVVVLRDDQPVAVEGSGEIDLALAVTLRLYLHALRDPNAELWR